MIQFVAEKLKENIRTSDLLVRYGGDEFIVLIENVGMERALKIAEKIRSEIYEAKPVDNVRCPDLKVSISIWGGNWCDQLDGTVRKSRSCFVSSQRAGEK